MLLQLSNHEKKIIELVSIAANTLGIRAFVVGGFVRDKLLGRPCMDIDIVCLGDAIELANAYQALIPSRPKISAPLT
jgi:tRNA nucleotidyltransferase/poly(A) polymerase